jgi:hypothetical protein
LDEDLNEQLLKSTKKSVGFFRPVRLNKNIIYV